MKLQIQIPQKKTHVVFIRMDDKLFDQIKILERKHKVERSAIIRSLIEAGLKSL